jgi:hypothetical protein
VAIMWTLTKFLAALPGVRPIISRRLILDGNLLSKDDKADIHCRDPFSDVFEVGPDAAAVILAAYKGGLLPMKKAARPAAAPSAESYLVRADDLRSEVAERRRKDRAIKDPSVIGESDFCNHGLIDRVFFANFGPGSGTMILAGIAVRKTVVEYKSNSGKSRGWLVRFDWTGSDGEHRYSESVPPEANNRRNDPGRNFGLPE